MVMKITSEEADLFGAYSEDALRFKGCLYRPPSSAHFQRRAPRVGPAIWIVKDGKPVDFAKKEDVPY